MTQISLVAAPPLQGYAPFDRIEPAGIAADTAAAIDVHRAAIDLACKTDAPSFSAVVLAREAADLDLAHMWSPIAHLSRVADTPELRGAYASAKETMTAHDLWLGQNRALYAAVRAVARRTSETAEPSPEHRLVQLSLRDFELSGVALAEAQRDRFRAIALELSRLSTDFSNAVLDATDAFHLDIRSEEDLAGVPEADRARFRAAAAAAGIEGYRVGLHAPDVHAILTHAELRSLRRALYEANATRASDRGPLAGRFDNSERIERIMALRLEAARLLGYRDSAEHSLVTKMATSAEAVEAFLLGLAGPAKRAAEIEMAELRTAALDLDIAHLEPWDVAYVSERLRRDKFDYDAEAVRAYFPVGKVVEGTMRLVEALFGIRFARRHDVPLWHEDAVYYDVVEHGGQPVAGLYLDLFARPGKIGGAWMDVCRQRFVNGDDVHLPAAFLNCNFAAADEGPATLHHGDVVTFLHEFGHALHLMLTEVDYPAIGGINGVEWDAVELPSQLMENFAWDYGALSLLSGHEDSGSPLPYELFERLTAARYFQGGMRLCRQIEFALFDLRLHRDYDPERGARALETIAAVRREVAVVAPPEWHRFPHAFTHIFAGGYAAGYYSYLWAELLSADAFALFREAGGVCPEVGSAFRREVLARGGSRTAAENFAAFRGRDPDAAALLASYGLDAQERPR